MTLFKYIAAAAALAGIAGAVPASAKVNVLQSPSAALARGSTFAWAPTPAIGYGVPDPNFANEVTADRLRAVTEFALANKGYRQVESLEEADFLVSYTVAILQTSEPELIASGGAPSFVRLDTSIKTKGILVLDLAERQTGRVVWRATSEKRITSKDVSQRTLVALLRKMTKSLPAR